MQYVYFKLRPIKIFWFYLWNFYVFLKNVEILVIRDLQAFVGLCHCEMLFRVRET